MKIALEFFATPKKLMRQPTLLLLLAVTVHASALATPHRAPAKPAHLAEHTPARKLADTHTVAHASTHTSAHPSAAAHKDHARVTPAPVAKGRGTHASVTRTPARLPAGRHHVAATPERHVARIEGPILTHAYPAHAAPARPTPEPVEKEAPAPMPAPQPEPHVTHDRKVHLEPDPTVAPIAMGQDGSPQEMPALYVRGRLVMPAALKGSHDILVHQNVMAGQDGLTRIADDADLARMRTTKDLVAIPTGAGLVVDERLPVDRRYTRPWTGQFLLDLARAHYARFHTPLQVNSAVRTVEFQTRLMRTNGNAAAIDGDGASPHLTGQAVDLAKHGLSSAEIAWMRGYLATLIRTGKIDVEEEFQQSCFHISVYRRYVQVKTLQVATQGVPVPAPELEHETVNQ